MQIHLIGHFIEAPVCAKTVIFLNNNVNITAYLLGPATVAVELNIKNDMLGVKMIRIVR